MFKSVCSKYREILPSAKTLTGCCLLDENGVWLRSGRAHIHTLSNNFSVCIHPSISIARMNALNNNKTVKYVATIYIYTKKKSIGIKKKYI